MPAASALSTIEVPSETSISVAVGTSPSVTRPSIENTVTRSTAAPATGHRSRSLGHRPDTATASATATGMASA